MSHFLAKGFACRTARPEFPPVCRLRCFRRAPDGFRRVKAQYHRPPVRGCSPMQAIRKARYSGLRDVRISTLRPAGSSLPAVTAVAGTA